MPNEKRLIDATALGEVLAYFENRHRKIFPFTADGYRTAQKIVAAMRTVNAVEVAHGWWQEYDCGVCCSNCGVSLFHQDTNNNAGIEPIEFKYCPYCGAKMDLPEPPKED